MTLIFTQKCYKNDCEKNIKYFKGKILHLITSFKKLNNRSRKKEKKALTVFDRLAVTAGGEMGLESASTGRTVQAADLFPSPAQKC